MSKIDLKSISGLPITYENDQLYFKDFTFREKVSITINDIRSQLLNQDLDCPEIFYDVYKWVDLNSTFKSKNVRINIYCLRANIAGIEYVKTKAMRCKKYPKILEVLHGSGTVLMQIYRSPKENRVFKSIIKRGQKIIIPSGYDFAVINTRQNTPLIFAEYTSIHAISRVVLDDDCGMAYYVIRKNAKQEIVRNSNYKIVNEPEKLDSNKLSAKYGITPKTPITRQILRKYEKFDWLFKENSVTI